jgi:hypothetical protein
MSGLSPAGRLIKGSGSPFERRCAVACLRCFPMINRSCRSSEEDMTCRDEPSGIYVRILCAIGLTWRVVPRAILPARTCAIRLGSDSYKAMC